MSAKTREHSANSSGSIVDAPKPDVATQRVLASSLLEAVRKGRRAHAEALAAAASRVPQRLETLARSLAIYHISEGRFETALHVLTSDHLRSGPATVQLRALTLTALGRASEARLEIDRSLAAPDATASMLQLGALLAWHDGDVEEAQRLLRAIEGTMPSGSLENHILRLAVRSFIGDKIGDDDKDMQRIHAHAVLPTRRLASRVALGTLNPGHANGSPAPHEEDAAALAAQLVAAEALIPTLLESQRQSLDEPSAALLYRALIIARDRLVDRAETMAAIAELSLWVEGPATARKWIESGLREHPMSVSLRRLDAAISKPQSEIESTSDIVESGGGVLAVIEPKSHDSATDEIDARTREKAA